MNDELQFSLSVSAINGMAKNVHLRCSQSKNFAAKKINCWIAAHASWHNTTNCWIAAWQKGNALNARTGVTNMIGIGEKYYILTVNHKIGQHIFFSGTHHSEQHKKMMLVRQSQTDYSPKSVRWRSACGYPAFPYHIELEEAMDAIATYEKLAPLSKVELRVSVQSPGTPQHLNRTRPTSNHCYEQGGLAKASDKRIGPRRSAREIKKGYGSA